MKTYICKPQSQGKPLKVMIRTDDGIFPLPPRRDLVNHSPTGFQCGYAGSGPAQLALALCADAFGDDELALQAYQKFKFAWVASVKPADGFEITDLQVRKICLQVAEPKGVA